MAENTLGSIPSNLYTKKEEGYKSTIKGQNTQKNNPAKIQRMTDAKGNTTGYLLTDKKGNVLERQDAQGKVIKDDYNKVSGITGMETDKAASKTQDVVDAAGNKTGKLRLTSDDTVYKAEDAAGDTIKSNYSTMNAITGMPDEENAPVNYLDANKPAPAGASAYKGGSGSASGSAGGSSSAETEEAMSAGIETDEPTEDLSSPATDEQIQQFMNNASDEMKQQMAASPQLKSIWSAWKNGEIDKETRNYFLVDALANFGKDIGNIKQAQNTNNMWANIESGTQVNPLENIGKDNQWQDYLKTDWKEAQKLKNEARSKEQLGNIENNLEVAKQYGMDNYTMNKRPELLKSSQMSKLAKEDPKSYGTVLQLAQLADGKAPLTGDQLNNVLDAYGNSELVGKLQQIGLDKAGIEKDILNISKEESKRIHDFNKACEDLEKQLKQGTINATNAGAYLTNLTAQGQGIENGYAKQAVDLRLRQLKGQANNALYGGTGISTPFGNINAGNIASGVESLMH